MKHCSRLPLIALLALVFTVPATGQSFTLSGLAYLDYAYELSTPDGSVGDNGFGYRRLYLTSDFEVNPSMRFRARLEASDSETNAGGKPAPFVKDLYLRWDNALGEGHRVTVGISSPPSFGVAEAFYGYRSLEKTIQDKNKIVSSRDFGVSVTGPLGTGGSLRYAFMVGNNNSVKHENDRHKRLYGQIEARPGDRIRMTFGADYASMPGGSSVNLNAFLGYRLDGARIGAEGYFNPVRPDDPFGEVDRAGLSVFGAASMTDNLEVVARYDYFEISPMAGGAADGWFTLLGIAWTPEANVQVIPNLLLDTDTVSDDPLVTARLTLHVDF